ncbi:uncharacterized protein KY384_003939 [Bacidia gigantensis]|uniref:uncharacterized protein n=1 Tax=Bacidia gigantensis TaxID=2732470 RepID=UPI001D0549AB|nr:uncharacterized protein KY384_003939 [Bacidia gigantensis]KAG8532298.1 hypothetical protein KY384_003939 [Bacidia gigantensis]
MTKGLFLARTFHLAGHNVIGADTSPYANGRFSHFIQRSYILPSPDAGGDGVGYLAAILRIIRQENINLWVSCSGVSSEVLDGQARDTIIQNFDGRVKCVQLSAALTEMLHAKDTFVGKVQELGLPAPETHQVTSRDSVHRLLNASSPRSSPVLNGDMGSLSKKKRSNHSRNRKSYILKPSDVNDASRLTSDLTILPRRTVSMTYNHLASIKISTSQPWVLQEFIPGKKEYCTHALIIRGEVKVFVACESSDLLMHYKSLPVNSALNIAMRKFTEEFARRLQEESGSNSKAEVTGHMSFDFLVKEEADVDGVRHRIWPIECNPRAHTAVALFRGNEKEMADAYLSALHPPSTESLEDDDRTLVNGHANLVTSNEILSEEAEGSSTITPRHQDLKVYWIGHDIVTLLIIPFFSLISLRLSFSNYVKGLVAFVDHVLFWQDGTYEVWDPLPAWWLYHVYWPLELLRCILWRGKWSRINVSTGKMFGC